MKPHTAVVKLFNCDNCRHTLYFENSRCVNCGEAVGYCPDLERLATLRQSNATDPNTFEIDGRQYRQCRNAVDYAACNWLVAVTDGQAQAAYCPSCALSEVIPDLSLAANDAAWRRIEAAKRRLLYTLNVLGLPVQSRAENKQYGLAFRFLKGSEDSPVMTGHEDGIITLNIDEADSAFRENMREKMGEAYRTVLGHLRHEIGHYYWFRFFGGEDAMHAGRVQDFRATFGDERADYEEAVQRHYSSGPPPNWGESFISAYASMHPWEDFAETWAHYLHMIDTLETAKSHGLTVLAPAAERSGERFATERLGFVDFDALVKGWSAVTLALNSLNRSMGMEDAYPFVFTAPVLEKLRCVHRLIRTPDRIHMIAGG